MDLIEKARTFCIEAHKNVNQFYGDKPYSYHLEMVANVVDRYESLLTDKEFILAKCAAYLHDTIEDARLTYNDIKKEFGEDIAEIVYAVTTEKGKNREERANEKYYKGIAKNKVATFVKICDRIANVCHSKKEKSSMFKKYKKEHVHFKDMLYYATFNEMFEELEQLFELQALMSKIVSKYGLLLKKQNLMLAYLPWLLNYLSFLTK